MRGWLLLIALAAGSAWLAACPNPTGTSCGTTSQCPPNSICLFNQCEPATSVAKNLSAVVWPSTPGLAPQQLLPAQLVSQNGFLAIELSASQQLVGNMPLPHGCLPDAGYPIHMHFEAPELIPGVPLTFDFYDDGLADAGLLGALPFQSDLQQQITTASACTVPLLGTHAVSAPGIIDVGGQQFVQFPDSGTVEIRGQVRLAGLSALDVGDAGVDGGLDAGTHDAGPPADLTGLAVRVIGVGGPEAGQAISLDGILEPTPFEPGTWNFDLPVEPSNLLSPPTGVKCGSLHCSSLIVEVGPSPQDPDAPTLDLRVVAPLLDAGAALLINLTGDAGLTLPIPLTPLFPVQVLALSDGGFFGAGLVAVATTDGGLWGCDAGCGYFDAKLTDGSGALTLDLLPGNYVFSLVPPAPFGQSQASVRVTADGGVFVGASKTRSPSVTLVAPGPLSVSGTVVDPGNRPLAGGEVSVLTLPDLVGIATGQLDAGTYSLLVPPGNYLLLIEPSASTGFPSLYQTIDVTTANLVLYSPVLEAGRLAGVVRVQGLDVDAGVDFDGGVTTSLPNALIQFYYVTSEASGQAIAIPVASAVTDSQGNWSAAIPPSN